MSDNETSIITAKSAWMQTKFGMFYAVAFQFSNSLEVALIKGKGNVPVLRIQSACLPSTALNSTMCDCYSQICKAQSYISEVEFGILIYLIDQEARGHGLLGKMDVMRMMNNEISLLEAQKLAGRASDLRTYEKIPPILSHLGIAQVDLLTNNSSKVEKIKEYGVQVRRTVQFNF
jgi:3,4-dihydroxy 2-butanone 4-phosphate synthase/GTP cyclohydrolase II